VVVNPTCGRESYLSVRNATLQTKQHPQMLHGRPSISRLSRTSKVSMRNSPSSDSSTLETESSEFVSLVERSEVGTPLLS
jgi:hypothetical protein